MAITSDFNEKRSMDDLNKQADVLYEKIINSFIYAGETFIINAREQIQDHAMGTYKDQTTNLRNSIQYYVFHNGELVKESESEFSSQNLALIQDLIKPSGFQLIGIAGMNYASYVESKGYNVISTQKDTCMVDLAGYLELIKEGTP